jgi:uncharacterized repeat protein (TIGR01451 family)
VERLEDRLAPANFVVNSTLDAIDLVPGDGQITTALGGNVRTLRAAIMEANALVGPDTILLKPGVYHLTRQGADEDGGASGDLDITDDLTILGTGVGVGPRIIDGGGLDRVFHIRDLAPGAGAPKTDVTLSEITLRDGHLPSGDGGGILMAGAGTLDLVNCTLTNNKANNGGGLYNQGAAIVTILASTLSGNQALFQGGGLWNSSGTLQVANSTVSGNMVTGTEAGAAGGGIFQGPADGLTALLNATVFDNTAPKGNGLAQTATGTVRLANTIVAHTITATPVADLDGTFVSLGSNLISDATGSTGITPVMNGDQAGDAATPIDAKLGALADNGGPTLTHALLTGSPALNAGNNNLAIALLADQRGFGFQRIVGPSSDIGAFEDQGPRADLVIKVKANPVAVRQGQKVRYEIRVTNRGPDSATGIVVTQELPVGMLFVSVMSSQGSSTLTGDRLLTNLGALANGATATITLTVRLNRLGLFRHSVAVDANEADPLPANNKALAASFAGQTNIISDEVLAALLREAR